MVMWILKRVLNPSITDYSDSTETEFLLDSDSKLKYRIGRGKSNDILITSLYVSREHCEITFVDGEPHIRDSKSENGTFVNGQKLVVGLVIKLQEGYKIGIGVDTNDELSCWLFEVIKQQVPQKPEPPLPLALAPLESSSTLIPNQSRELQELPLSVTSTGIVSTLGVLPQKRHVNEECAVIVLTSSDSESENEIESDGSGTHTSGTAIGASPVQVRVETAQARLSVLQETSEDLDDECIIIEDLPSRCGSRKSSEEGIANTTPNNTALEVGFQKSRNSITSPASSSDKSPSLNVDHPISRFFRRKSVTVIPHAGSELKNLISTRTDATVATQNSDCTSSIEGDLGTGPSVEMKYQKEVDSCGTLSEDVEVNDEIESQSLKTVPELNTHACNKDNICNAKPVQTSTKLDSSPVELQPAVKHEGEPTEKTVAPVLCKNNTARVTTSSLQTECEIQTTAWLCKNKEIKHEKGVENNTEISNADVHVTTTSHHVSCEEYKQFISPEMENNISNFESVKIKLETSANESHFTNCDDIEIIVDDDDDAPFPSSQISFIKRTNTTDGPETRDNMILTDDGRRSTSPPTDIMTICLDDDSDLDEDDDDDDNVDLWYCRLSQESPDTHRVRRNFKSEHDDEFSLFLPRQDVSNSSHSNGGSSKDSGLSLSESNSDKADIKNNLVVNEIQKMLYASDAESSDNDDLFDRKPEKQKENFRDLTNEAAKKRRLSEPGPSSKSTKNLDKVTDEAKRRQSTGRLSTSKRKLSSTEELKRPLDSLDPSQNKKKIKLSHNQKEDTKLLRHVSEKASSSRSVIATDDLDDVIFSNMQKNVPDKASVSKYYEEVMETVSTDGEEPNQAESAHKVKDKAFPRKPKLIDALPMPHRRSHQRGISGSEAQRLFEERRSSEEEKRSKPKDKKNKMHHKEKVLATTSNQRVKARTSNLLSKKSCKSLKMHESSRPRSSKTNDTINERRRKLQEIASKGKALSAEKEKILAAVNATKLPAKVIAKVTDKTRGSMLAKEFTSESNNNPAHTAGVKKPFLPPVPPFPAPKTTIPKKPPQNKSVCPKAKEDAVVSSSSNFKIPLTKKVVPSTIPEQTLIKPLSSITNLLPKKSCLSSQCTSTINQKKSVRFMEGDALCSVRKYTPEPELLNRNKPLQRVGTNKDIVTPYLCQQLTPVEKSFFDTLDYVLAWNVAWFKQVSDNPDNAPPVHGNMQRIQMLSQFSSYSDYWKVVYPLMLMNLWACVVRDECSGEPKHIYPLAIDSQVIVREDNNLCRIHGHTLLTNQMTTGLPMAGDLIVLQLNGPKQVDENSQVAQRAVKFIFGYVERVRKDVLSDNMIVHSSLTENIHAPNFPKFMLRLTALIKNRNEVIRTELLSKIKVVSYIKPSIRCFQAVGTLCSSSLCKYILKPHVQDYSLPNQLKHSEINDLLTSLNKSQYAAVCRAAEACLSNEPKICMIQGPPGTGKSFVIVKLIQSILKCANSQVRRSTEPFRILLCAPSNAAVDELVLRLLAVRKEMKKEERFKLVRIGVTHASTDPLVKLITLEKLVSNDMVAKAMSKNDKNSALPSIELEINTLKAKVHAAQLQLEAAETETGKYPVGRNSRIEVASLRLSSYQQKLRKLELSRTGIAMQSFDNRRKRETEHKILRGANIIASTLNSCTNGVMEGAFLNRSEKPFSCCIIDEASQCCEPENLLPLLLNIETLVLVGDPMQLPATTISKVAKDLGFGTSLFSRLSECFGDVDPSPVQFLEEQYRMHPNILRWPNLRFYSNRMITNSKVRERRKSPLLPYLILKHDCLQKNDMVNQGEVELINTVVNCILDNESTSRMRIGVITPYNRQRQKLASVIQRRNITISTIDGFQGQERDIIIMSCVRTDGMGFMSDGQRLNVALTRAKYSLIICANFLSLQENCTWRNLHEDALHRNVVKQLYSRDVLDSSLISKMLFK